MYYCGAIFILLWGVVGYHRAYIVDKPSYILIVEYTLNIHITRGHMLQCYILNIPGEYNKTPERIFNKQRIDRKTNQV